MHPDPTFGWTDADALAAFAGQVGFAHLFVTGPRGHAVAHVAMLVCETDRLQFHMPIRNRATALLPGATLIASFAGPDAYISPDWYGIPDQVPTWNYAAAEAEGRAEPLDRAGLVAHLDALSAVQERRLAPKPAWTRAKMAPDRFDAMLPAIIGYDLHVTAWRGTIKMSQNKPGVAISGVVAGLCAAGAPAVAQAVRDANAHRLPPTVMAS